MSSRVTIQLKGVNELSKALQQLPEKMQRKVVIPAAKEAMEPVQDDAIAYARRIDDPATPQKIFENIAMRARPASETPGEIVVSVGVKRQKAEHGGGNTYYWWWVELGTEHSAPRPFLRLAFYQNRDRVLKDFIRSAKFNLIGVAS